MVPLKMDVTDKDSILYAVKVIEENEGKLDILVNNAGGVGAIYPLRAGFSDDSGSVRDERWSDSFFFNLRNFEDWSEIFKVNTTAAFFVTMAFVDLLKRGAKDGQTSSVILVTSVGAILKCCNNKPAYAASKAAIESLTNHLGAEFAYNGLAIRVNSILPGFFRTDILPPETYVELNDLLRSGTPYVAGTGAVPMRRFGAEEEMAATAVYLGSPMSGYTNGSHIVVDGGWHLVTT
ncbi:hypothetical protein VNI00_012831 [Paramarasmius palmivorus]|uniref:Uncharacterized protein n=1 Tax=Paramarasmius palmivorus TaxID=297713 RepID=A0AAW0C5G4_9AGAR